MKSLSVDQPAGLLARRYPAQRTSFAVTQKTVYVLRECLNFEERQANILSLRGEGRAVLADALQLETDRLFSAKGVRRV